MSRRYLLVASSAASLGYVVGWLAGSNVQRMAEGRRLGRPEPRTALPAPVESPEPRIGRETGAQRCSDVDLWSRLACTLDAGHDGDHHAKAGEGSQWWWTNTPPIPTQRDDEPCPVTLGALTCPFRGPHTSHAFQSGTWAPDRKDDTDEGIE